MNFNDFIIDREDYDFFQSLPKDEKILFIYDLICEEAFGPGSVEAEIVDTIKNNSSDFSFELENFKDHLSSLVKRSINPEAKVNVLIVNNKIILNSESKKLLDDTVKEMFMDGCVMTNYKMTEEVLKIFKQQAFCKAFILAGKSDRIIEN